jgi:transposase
METAYDGRQVVGMDLHRRRSVLVRMTGDGRRLGTARITSSPQELRREIARAGKSPRVVLEATYGWYWAADTLAAAGAEVHLAHPLGVKAFTYRRVKNDDRDAADLADLLRMGRLPEAWIAPAGVRELRELTRYRGDPVHQRGPAVLMGRADPRHRESGTKITRGHITKQGSRLLRWALIEAIQHVPAGSLPGAVKQAIIARRGKEAKHIAKVAAARRLPTLVCYGMRDGHIRCLSSPQDTPPVTPQEQAA